jgi:hypothetical protein
MTPLQYYFVKNNNIEHVIFDKYTIDKNGVIINIKSGTIMRQHKSKDGYTACAVRDNFGKQRGIKIGRALASLRGPPPTSEHTADHIDRNPNNNTMDNIRWATKKKQCENQERPETKKSTFIIVKDGLEKTAKEWVEYLKGNKNHAKREYTTKMIFSYVYRKQHGFAFKEYPDLPGEVWKKIEVLGNIKGCWEISDMNRVKYITKNAENVLSGDRLGLKAGYPVISLGKCHILAFKTFFPEEYAAKKPGEIVLHENDDRMDFRPHKLRLGTRSENLIDAHDNDSFSGKKTARMKCASYIDGVIEKEHASQSDAMRYLKSLGLDKAAVQGINKALAACRKGENITRYDRTWKIV